MIPKTKIQKAAFDFMQGLKNRGGWIVVHHKSSGVAVINHPFDNAKLALAGGWGYDKTSAAVAQVLMWSSDDDETQKRIARLEATGMTNLISEFGKLGLGTLDIGPTTCQFSCFRYDPPKDEPKPEDRHDIAGLDCKVGPGSSAWVDLWINDPDGPSPLKKMTVHLCCLTKRGTHIDIYDDPTAENGPLRSIDLEELINGQKG